jgi:hypothetical protein
MIRSFLEILEMGPVSSQFVEPPATLVKPARPAGVSAKGRPRRTRLITRRRGSSMTFADRWVIA